MLGAKAVAQGRKGTGNDKQPIGIRCPPDIYRWLSAGKGPRETDTERVLSALEKVMEMEAEAGPRLQELFAAAVMEQTSFGKMVARLALEGIDARRLSAKRGKK